MAASTQMGRLTKEALKAAARQRLAAGLGELRPRAGGGGGPAADRGDSSGVLVGRVVAGCQPFLEDRTGCTIQQFVRTARRYRTVQIRVGDHILTAEEPLAPELRDALALIC